MSAKVVSNATIKFGAYQILGESGIIKVGDHQSFCT
jgi:hypothetical protein